jgi:hypothetical protein
VAQGGWPVRRGLLAEQSRPHANDLWTLAGYVPSLDLRFAETKSLRDQVTGQNLVSFSRSSAGTFVDAGGIIRSAAANEPRFDHDPATGRCLGLLVEEARTNAIKCSQNIGRSPWQIWNLIVQQNATIAPDGTATASLLIANSTNASHEVFLAGGSGDTATPNFAPYRFSGYFKYNGHRYVGFYCNINANIYGHFDLLNGTAALGSISLVGNGWYKCVGRQYPAAANNANNTLRVSLTTSSSAPAQNGVAFVGDNVSGVYAWGLQSEADSFPTSYIPTPATFTSRASTATFYDANGIIQTAATNVARSNAFFPDSNGVMVPAGLLLEAAATNLLNGSQTFATSGGTQNDWVDTNITRDGTLRTSPSGVANALRVTAAADNATIISSAAIGTSALRAFSIFLRRVNGTGAIQYTLDNGTTWISQAITTGWTRYIFPATTAAQQVGIRITTNGDAIELWGAQLETGTYPTSYIPTTTATVTRAADVSSSATVTRSADVAQINTLNTNIRSLFARARGPASGVRGIIGLDDNSASNRVELYTNNTDPKFTLTAADTIVSDLDGGTVAANVEARIAARFAFNNGAISLNGNPEVTSNSGALPSVNRLRIGALQAGNTFNGTLARLTTWDQSLTSLPNITRPS